MNRPRLYVLGSVAALAAAFFAGRYSTPTKVEHHTEFLTRTQVVRTVAIQRVTDIKWKRVIVSTPDGGTTVTETEDTHIDERTNENTKTNTDAKEATATKTQTLRPTWQISALVGTDVTSVANALNGSGPLRPTAGIHVSRRVLGPVTVGAFGLSSGTFGVSAGLLW